LSRHIICVGVRRFYSEFTAASREIRIWIDAFHHHLLVEWITRQIYIGRWSHIPRISGGALNSLNNFSLFRGESVGEDLILIESFKKKGKFESFSINFDVGSFSRR
jgi:hypothetical protein